MNPTTAMAAGKPKLANKTPAAAGPARPGSPPAPFPHCALAGAWQDPFRRSFEDTEISAMQSIRSIRSRVRRPYRTVMGDLEK